MALQNVFSMTNTNISQADQTFLQGLANLGQRTGIAGDGVCASSFSIGDLFGSGINKELDIYPVYYIKKDFQNEHMRGKCYIPAYNPSGDNAIDYFTKGTNNENLNDLYAKSSILEIPDTSKLIDESSHSVNIYGSGVSSIKNIIIEHESSNLWVYSFVCVGADGGDFILIECVDTTGTPSIKYAYKIEKNEHNVNTKYLYSYGSHTAYRLNRRKAEQALYTSISQYLGDYINSPYGTKDDSPISIANLINNIITCYELNDDNHPLNNDPTISFNNIFGSDINKTFVEIRNIYNETYFESDVAIEKQIIYNLCKTLEDSITVDELPYFRIFIPKNFKFNFLCNDNSSYIQPYCSIDNIYVYYLNIEGEFNNATLNAKLNEIDSKDTSVSNYIYVYTYNENNKTDKISFYNFTGQYDNLSIGKCFSWIDLSLKYTLPYINNNNWFINGLNTNINTVTENDVVPNVVYIDDDGIVFPNSVISELNGYLTKKPITLTSFTDTEIGTISTGKYLNIRNDSLEVNILNGDTMHRYNDDIANEYKNTLVISKTCIKDSITEDFLSKLYGSNSYITTFWGYNENNNDFEQLSGPLLSSYATQNLMNYYINSLAEKVNDLALYYKSLSIESSINIGKVQTEIKNNDGTTDKTFVSSYIYHQSDNSNINNANRLRLEITDKSNKEDVKTWYTPNSIALLKDYNSHPCKGNKNYIIADNIPEINLENQLVSNINAVNRVNILSLSSQNDSTVGCTYYGYIGLTYDALNASYMTIGTASTVPNIGDYLIDSDNRGLFKPHNNLRILFNEIYLNDQIAIKNGSGTYTGDVYPKTNKKYKLGSNNRQYKSTYVGVSFVEKIGANNTENAETSRIKAEWVSEFTTTYSAYFKQILPNSTSSSIGWNRSEDIFDASYVRRAYDTMLIVGEIKGNYSTFDSYFKITSNVHLNGSLTASENIGQIGTSQMPFRLTYNNDVYVNNIYTPCPLNGVSTTNVNLNGPTGQIIFNDNKNNSHVILSNNEITFKNTKVKLSNINITSTNTNVGNHTSYIDSAYVTSTYNKSLYVNNMYSGTNDVVNVLSKLNIKSSAYVSEGIFVKKLSDNGERDIQMGISIGGDVDNVLNNETGNFNNLYISYGFVANTDTKEGLKAIYISNNGNVSTSKISASQFVGPADSLTYVKNIALTYTDGENNVKTYTTSTINYNKETIEINLDKTVTYLGSYVSRICNNYIHPSIGINIVSRISYIYDDDFLNGINNYKLPDGTIINEVEQREWISRYNTVLKGYNGYYYLTAIDDAGNVKHYDINNWDSEVNLDINNYYSETSGISSKSGASLALSSSSDYSGNNTSLNNDQYIIRSFGATKEDSCGYPTLIPIADVSRLYYKVQYIYADGTFGDRTSVYNSFNEFNVSFTTHDGNNSPVFYKRWDNYTTYNYVLWQDDIALDKTFNSISDYPRFEKSGSDIAKYMAKSNDVQHQITQDANDIYIYPIKISGTYADVVNKYITDNQKKNELTEDEYVSKFYGYIGKKKAVIKTQFVDDKSLSGGSASGNGSIGQLSMIGNIYSLRSDGNMSGTSTASITIKLGYNLQYNILRSDSKLFEPQIIKLSNITEDNLFCEGKDSEKNIVHLLNLTGDIDREKSYIKVLFDKDHYFKYICIPHENQNLYIKCNNAKDATTTIDGIKYLSFNEMLQDVTFNSDSDTNYNALINAINKYGKKNESDKYEFFSYDYITVYTENGTSITSEDQYVMTSVSQSIIEYYNKIFFGVTKLYKKINDKYEEQELTTETYSKGTYSKLVKGISPSSVGDFYIIDESIYSNSTDSNTPTPLYLLVLKCYGSEHSFKFEGLYDNTLITYSKNPTNIQEFASRRNLYLTNNEKYIKAYPLNYTFSRQDNNADDWNDNKFCTTNIDGTQTTQDIKYGKHWTYYNVVAGGILDYVDHTIWTKNYLTHDAFSKANVRINQIYNQNIYTAQIIPTGEWRLFDDTNYSNLTESKIYYNLNKLIMDKMYADNSDGYTYMFYRVWNKPTGHNLFVLNLHAFAKQIGLYDLIGNNTMYGGTFSTSTNVEYYPMSATDGLFYNNCYLNGKLSDDTSIDGMINSPIWTEKDWLHSHNRGDWDTYGYNTLNGFGLWLGKSLHVSSTNRKKHFEPMYWHYGVYNHPITVTIRQEFNTDTNAVKVRVMLDEY